MYIWVKICGKTVALLQLASIIDFYVRRVFRKVITKEELNYNVTSESKSKTRAYFRKLAQ